MFNEIYKKLNNNFPWKQKKFSFFFKGKAEIIYYYNNCIFKFIFLY